MRKAFVAMAVVALVATGGLLLAHEGHEHKVMGKVVTIDEKKIEVESTDGKRVAGVLSAETKYLRDKVVAARTDVKVGERVVIVVVEDKDKVQNVKQVLLGAAPSADHKH
jgi:predicted DNA repair protein MutK